MLRREWLFSPGTLSEGCRQGHMNELTFAAPHTHEVSGFQGEQLQPGFQLPWVSLGTISVARFIYKIKMNGTYSGGTL